MLVTLIQGLWNVIPVWKAVKDLKSQSKKISKKLEKLSLLVKKNDKDSRINDLLRQNLISFYKRRGQACEHGKKKKHTVSECWKHERDNKFCFFCNRKDQEAEDYWARVEREKGLKDAQGQV